MIFIPFLAHVRSEICMIIVRLSGKHAESRDWRFRSINTKIGFYNPAQNGSSKKNYLNHSSLHVKHHPNAAIPLFKILSHFNLISSSTWVPRSLFFSSEYYWRTKQKIRWKLKRENWKNRTELLKIEEQKIEDRIPPQGFPLQKGYLLSH